MVTVGVLAVILVGDGVTLIGSAVILTDFGAGDRFFGTDLSDLVAFGRLTADALFLDLCLKLMKSFYNTHFSSNVNKTYDWRGAMVCLPVVTGISVPFSIFIDRGDPAGDSEHFGISNDSSSLVS